MDELVLDERKSVPVKVKIGAEAFEFQAKEPMILELVAGEESETKQLTRTVDMLKDMGTPDGLLEKMASSHAAEFCEFLLGKFKKKK